MEPITNSNIKEAIRQKHEADAKNQEQQIRANLEQSKKQAAYNTNSG